MGSRVGLILRGVTGEEVAVRSVSQNIMDSASLL